MATVRMKKGIVYADVFDSPETIRNAQLEGYSLVEEKPKKEVKEDGLSEGKEEKVTEKQTEEQSEDKIVHKKSAKK